MTKAPTIIVGLILILGLIGIACGPGATPTPTPTPTRAPQGTIPTASPTPTPTATPTTARTLQPLTIDIQAGRVLAPDLYNLYLVGARTDFGHYQALVEPVFALNYATGQMEEWLGTSFESNAAMDE